MKNQWRDQKQPSVRNRMSLLRTISLFIAASRQNAAKPKRCDPAAEKVSNLHSLHGRLQTGSVFFSNATHVDTTFFSLSFFHNVTISDGQCEGSSMSCTNALRAAQEQLTFWASHGLQKTRHKSSEDTARSGKGQQIRLPALDALNVSMDFSGCQQPASL